MNKILITGGYGLLGVILEAEIELTDNLSLEKETHKISVNEFEKFNQYQLVYEHENFNKNEIRNLLNKCYNDYYLRISWFFKYLKSFIN